MGPALFISSRVPLPRPLENGGCGNKVAVGGADRRNVRNRFAASIVFVWFYLLQMLSGIRAAWDLRKAEMEIAHLSALMKSEQETRHAKIGELAAILSQSLRCHICNDILADPHLLPECGHIFCANCLQQWTRIGYLLFVRDHQDLCHLHEHLRLATASEIKLAISNVSERLPTLHCPSCDTQLRGEPVRQYQIQRFFDTLGRVQSALEGLE